MQPQPHHTPTSARKAPAPLGRQPAWPTTATAAAAVSQHRQPVDDSWPRRRRSLPAQRSAVEVVAVGTRLACSMWRVWRVALRRVPHRPRPWQCRPLVIIRSRSTRAYSPRRARLATKVTATPHHHQQQQPQFQPKQVPPEHALPQTATSGLKRSISSFVRSMCSFVVLSFLLLRLVLYIFDCLCVFSLYV